MRRAWHTCGVALQQSDAAAHAPDPLRSATPTSSTSSASASSSAATSATSAPPTATAASASSSTDATDTSTPATTPSTTPTPSAAPPPPPPPPPAPPAPLPPLPLPSREEMELPTQWWTVGTRNFVGGAGRDDALTDASWTTVGGAAVTGLMAASG
ncbi:unnamed protein product [Closterium sp. NIES-64]|nr:unnamed protein product [Closterium sp. NIES-64]